MARTGDFSHTPNFDFGENLYYFTISKGSAQLYERLDCNRATAAWYEEIKNYNWKNPQASFGMIGHFTQMVWKDSAKVGCAKAYNSQRGTLYVTCHYDPPGNVIGTYPSNVLPLK